MRQTHIITHIQVIHNLTQNATNNNNDKGDQRDANTARAGRSKEFGLHRPPARCKHTQTHTPTDRTDYNRLRRS